MRTQVTSVTTPSSCLVSCFASAPTAAAAAASCCLPGSCFSPPRPSAAAAAAAAGVSFSFSFLMAPLFLCRFCSRLGSAPSAGSPPPALITVLASSGAEAAAGAAAATPPPPLSSSAAICRVRRGVWGFECAARKTTPSTIRGSNGFGRGGTPRCRGGQDRDGRESIG